MIAALVEAAVGRADRKRRAQRIAAVVRRAGGYRWVGIYDVTPDGIAVVGWDGPGPPAHPSFPRTAGLCGAAVAARETVVVGDVDRDPRYLTTLGTTRAEVVVPVVGSEGVVGLIDVESERPHAFDERDTRLLERCAGVIAPLWRSA